MILTIIIFADMLTFLFIRRCIFDYYHKIFAYLMLTGFTLYSGIGIQFQQNKISTPYIYLMQFVLFMIVFVFMIWFSERLKKGKALSDSDIILNSSILIVFTIIYLFTFLYQLIYSGRSINSFTDIVNIFIHYSPTTFSERLSRKNNEMYVIMTNQIRSIAAPFFYIYLYKVKDKIFKFLLLFTMPILLKTVADGYLSRNNIAVYLAFIGIYLVKEKYIPKTVAKFSLLIIIPIGLFLFYIMSQIRLGTQSDISFWQGTWNLIDSESSYPQYYDYANQGNSNVNIINFIIYIFIVCIPSSFYDLIHFSIPNLAYTFTETILGLSYGETNNYYILLPSVLGEAIMLCGKYFAFTYAFIYGIVSTWFLRLLKRNKSLEYLLIYYLLDFFRQFRGGSQYVITAWETQLVPLIIIVFFYKLVIKNGVAKERNEYNV